MNLYLLSELLKELLIKNKRVALPGMGSFVLEDMPSVFLMDGKTITPPAKKIYFRTAEIKDDGLLERAYVKKTGVSLDEGKAAVSLCVKGIRATLIENMKVEIPNFGTISFGDGYAFYFSPDKNLTIFPDGYPLESVSLKPDTVAVVGSDVPRSPDSDQPIDHTVAAQLEEYTYIAVATKSEEPAVNMKDVEQSIEEIDINFDEDYTPDAVNNLHDLNNGDNELQQIPGPKSIQDIVSGWQRMAEQENVAGNLAGDPDENLKAELLDENLKAELPDEVLRKEPAETVPERNSGDDAEQPEQSGKAEWTELAELEREDEEEDQGYIAVDISAISAENPQTESEKEGTIEFVGKKEPREEKENTVEKRRPKRWVLVFLILLGVVLLLAVLVYLYKEDLMPVLERLLYTKEELEILREAGQV